MILDEDMTTIIAEYAAKYPPLVTISQAAEIAQVAVQTVHDWSSTGKLAAFKTKRGRAVRLARDGFVRFLFAGSSKG